MNNCVQVCEYLFSLLSGIYFGVEWLGPVVSLCLIFWGTTRPFSTVVAYFAFPPEIYKGSKFSTSLPAPVFSLKKKEKKRSIYIVVDVRYFSAVCVFIFCFGPTAKLVGVQFPQPAINLGPWQWKLTEFLWGFLSLILYFYLYLATLGLCCCRRAFSSCGKWGYSLVPVRGLLISVA